MSRWSRIVSDGAGKQDDILEGDDDDDWFWPQCDDGTHDSDPDPMHTLLTQAGYTPVPSTPTYPQMAQQRYPSPSQQQMNDAELLESANSPSTTVTQSVFARNAANTEQPTGDRELTDSNASTDSSVTSTSDSDDDNVCNFLKRDEQILMYDQLMSLFESEEVAVYCCQFYPEKVVVIVMPDTKKMLEMSRLCELTGLDAKRFDIRRLERMPDYKLTCDSIAPGDLIGCPIINGERVERTGVATLGAFAETEKCKVAFTAGHHRSVGEHVYHLRSNDEPIYRDGRRIYARLTDAADTCESYTFDDRNDRIGIIEKKPIVEGDQGTPTCDVALIELAPDVRAENAVQDADDRRIVLCKDACRVDTLKSLRSDLEVVKFCRGAGEVVGLIDHEQPLLNQLSRDGIFFNRCIQVQERGVYPFIVGGESGTLLTTKPDDNCVVNGIGILFGRFEMMFDNGPKICSLAQPLRPTLRRIKSEYKFRKLQLTKSQPTPDTTVMRSQTSSAAFFLDCAHQGDNRSRVENNLRTVQVGETQPSQLAAESMPSVEETTSK